MATSVQLGEMDIARSPQSRLKFAFLNDIADSRQPDQGKNEGIIAPEATVTGHGAALGLSPRLSCPPGQAKVSPASDPPAAWWIRSAKPPGSP